MYRKAASILLLSLTIYVLHISKTSAQTCPISTQRANSLSFSGVKKSCVSLDSSRRSSCDACLCSLTDTFVPALKSVGFDLQKAGGFAGAERILQSCMMILAVPLAAAGVPLSSLLGLTQCAYDAKTYPACVSDYMTKTQKPMVDEYESSSVKKESKERATEAESFVEDIAADCRCSSEFDPVCDYSGYWYTNYCVSKCKGAKLVERCTPVFKTVEEREEPFILTEKDGPFTWKAGCQCPEGDSDFDPVCDIDGRQYSSHCYANCLGATDVFDCSALVVDFELSGQGFITEEPIVEAQDGRELDTPKPNVTDITKPKKAPVVQEPKPVKTQELPEEVVALFTQLGVDVSAFPPEITLMAYKIIQGKQITDEELARARILLQDKERMAEARLRITPAYLQQLRMLASGSTGNNKMLLDELIAALSEGPERPKDENSIGDCIKGCKPGKPVCSTETGEEFATACHARCSGVTDAKSCYRDDDESAASQTSIGLTCSIFSVLLGAAVVAHI